MYIPYPVEGEILQVQPQYSGDKNVVRYLCKAYDRNGSEILIANAEEASNIGGISDYDRRVARASTESPIKQGDPSQANFNASVGDRVLIMFINGNILHPVIVAYLQHPNQLDEMDAPETKKPMRVIQYLGIREVFDSDGQYRIIHKGLPEVKHSPLSGMLGGAVGAIAGKATGAISSLGGGISPKIIGNYTVNGSSTSAVSKPKEEDITLLEFLKKGIFRVRDSKGGMFELDHNKDRVYISNNDLKSTEDPDGGPLSGGLQMLSNSTDAEYVLLDRKKELVLINARKIAQIYSFDQRKDVTEGDHQHKVGGDSKWIISGDSLWQISGSQEVEIESDYYMSVSGAYDVEVKKDATFVIEGELFFGVKKSITIQSDDSLDLSTAGELIFNITKNMSLNTDGDLEISSGKNIVVSAGSNLEVEATQDVIIGSATGSKLKLSGGQVALGGSSGGKTVELLQLFEDTLNAITKLTVGTGTGPSSPPMNLADFTKILTDLALIKGSL
jgi:hypothetical protein